MGTPCFLSRHGPTSPRPPHDFIQLRENRKFVIKSAVFSLSAYSLFILKEPLSAPAALSLPDPQKRLRKEIPMWKSRVDGI